MPTAEIRIRPAREDDDADAIATYLYLTDPYIYPAFCSSCRDAIWISFLRANLGNPTHFFAAKRLAVAERAGHIVGICNYFPCGEPLTFLQNVPKRARADYRFADAHYFAPLREKIGGMRGIYIANLCVDPACRRIGIGQALLRFVLTRCPGQDLLLDVLADNVPAISLYRKMGFLSQGAERGFGGRTNAAVSCLQMRRPADGAARPN